MKTAKAHPESDTLARDASRICCLTRVNSLLKSLRMKHGRSVENRSTNGHPLAAPGGFGLIPAMTLKAPVLSVKSVRAGSLNG